MAPSGETSQKG